MFGDYIETLLLISYFLIIFLVVACWQKFVDRYECYERLTSSVQSLSCVRLFVTPWTTAQASLSVTNSWSLPKPMSIKSVMPSSHLILCHPLLFLPSIFPSIGSFPMSQFSSGGQSIGVSASASVLPNEYSRLISFRIDWLDLLAVQETLKSLLQHHSSKVSILQCSALFLVQLSHPYMTTG